MSPEALSARTEALRAHVARLRVQRLRTDAAPVRKAQAELVRQVLWERRIGRKVITVYRWWTVRTQRAEEDITAIVDTVSETRDERTQPCPCCGQSVTMVPYDIGSGPEMSCPGCECCWGADGQPLRRYEPPAGLAGDPW